MHKEGTYWVCMAEGSSHRLSLGLRRLMQHLWGRGCLSETLWGLGVPMKSPWPGPAQPGVEEAAAARPAP